MKHMLIKLDFFLIVLLTLQWNISTFAALGQMLHGSVPKEIQRLGLQPIDRLSSTTQLHLAIGLSLRNEHEISKLLHDLYDPASPNFHKYLTFEQIKDSFSPSEQDYQALIEFAKKSNLSVTGMHSSRMLLNVVGSVADIEKTFRLHMFLYKRPNTNETFYAPDVEPSMDADLPVLQIKGLTNYSLPHAVVQSRRSGQKSGHTQSSSNDFIGDAFRNAYVPETSLDGSGQSVGLVEFDGYKQEDITDYEQILSQRTNLVPVEIVRIGSYDGTPSGDLNQQAEVTLDIDMAIAMAPKLSKVIVFGATNDNETNWDAILDSMMTHPEIKQFSSSWNALGEYVDLIAEQDFWWMGLQGQSFFQASGDHCAYSSQTVFNPQRLEFYNSAPSFPQDDTNITTVGGTELNTSSNNSWSSESVWNNGFQIDNGRGNYEGSGGGVSETFAIPSWQQQTSMVQNLGSSTMRNVPDVALVADQVVISLNSKFNPEAGTSCAAPLWAAFIALVNQQCAANGRPTVGFINPAIYSIGNSSRYNSDFHDIADGTNNEWPGSPSRYEALYGYDLCTGWGTPNGQALIDDLSGAVPGRLSSGSINTSSGTINTQFIFSATYQSPTNQPPDSILVVVDGKSYKLSAQSSDLDQRSFVHFQFSNINQCRECRTA